MVWDYIASEIIHLGGKYNKLEYFNNMIEHAECPDHDVDFEYEDFRIEDEDIVIEGSGEWYREGEEFEGKIEIYLKKVDCNWLIYNYVQKEVERVDSDSNMMNAMIKEEESNIMEVFK